MVRRARVPRDSNNRILYGRFSHRDLSGWPDGVVHTGKRKKRKERKQKEKPSVDASLLPKFIPEAVEIGIPL